MRSRRIPWNVRPGDAILLNDPLLGSGHLPDFFCHQPAFHEGRSSASP